MVLKAVAQPSSKFAGGMKRKGEYLHYCMKKNSLPCLAWFRMAVGIPAFTFFRYTRILVVGKSDVTNAGEVAKIASKD